MRQLLLSLALVCPLAAGVAAATPNAFAAGAADSSLLTEKFSVDDTTAVPGATLKNGSYTIRVVDHMSDRSILRVENAEGKVITTFLGVPNRAMAGSAMRGPVAWTGGSNHDRALRGFNFPGGYSVEFVYPKDEAVKIATKHAASVAAIDPASDNLPSKQKDLSSDDMRMVTLWSLSPTRVNGTPGIAAEKLKQTPAPEPVVARNEPPAGLPAPRAARATTAPVAPAPVKPERRPLAKALPHTASELPAVMLAGMLSLVGILTLRIRRQLLQR